ncbi:MAG: DsbA family protein [Trueperaceae bacterium]|nr:MAG: DsbA family protein [Trueperaceae bacterium]
MKRWFLYLLAALILSTADASIGEPTATLLEPLQEYDPTLQQDGSYLTSGGFGFTLDVGNGLVVGLRGQGVLDDLNIEFVASLLDAATGYGADVSGAVQTFLQTRTAPLSGQGEVILGIGAYLWRLQVSGEAPFEVDFELAIQEIGADVFQETPHTLGPADARFVIREFSDFQCPFCANYAMRALPDIKEELLVRGDVRFEYHHFPLRSIHANAARAAEAAECVAENRTSEAFWRYHDALFETQADWKSLQDPIPFFEGLASELELDGEIENCLTDGRYADVVETAYRHATETLRLTGTPTVFVNGIRVENPLELSAYLRLFDLIEALSAVKE